MRSTDQRRRADAIARTFETGVAHHQAGRLEAAERAYSEVLRRVPEHAASLHMLGLLALQRRDAAAALVLFDRALAAGEGGAGIHLNRGSALRALARRAEALESYDLALSIDPRLVGAHVNRGNVLRDEGELDRAAAAYRVTLDLDPSAFAAVANLGFVLARQPGADAEALPVLERAAALASRLGVRGPDVANCMNAMGMIHRRAARLDDAISAFEAACEQDPEFAEAHFNLAGVLSDAGRHDEALPCLERSRNLAPGLAGLLPALALAFRRLGRRDDALEVYREWSEKEPENPVPAHMIRALSGGEPPATATEDYVRMEFDGFAATFDAVLRQKLDYRAPEVVAGAIEATLGPVTRRLDVADLGCGTGLCGPLLRARASRLVGVDISPKMVERAVERGYDELVVAEIVSYCDANRSAFDLLVAADVMVYLGDLVPLFTAARTSLRPGGWFAFTVERGREDAPGYALNVGGALRARRGVCSQDARGRRVLGDLVVRGDLAERAWVRGPRSRGRGACRVIAGCNLQNAASSCS